MGLRQKCSTALLKGILSDFPRILCFNYRHLVIEKLLKAYYVKNIGTSVPPAHDLTKIAEKAKLILSENQKNFLDEVTTFNIKARYPDYKNRFYRKATKEFTRIYVTKIKEFRQWLIERIKNNLSKDTGICSSSRRKPNKNLEIVPLRLICKGTF